ncbi:hypothetical protein Tco_0836629 [Tanacetum coccineum]
MSNTNNNNMQTKTSSALHNAIMEAGGKDHPSMLAPGNYFLTTDANATPVTLGNKGTSQQQPKGEIILTGIDNDIYSTFDACPNAMEMWKEIERLKQGESLESYYSRFYKMMNGLVRNQCIVTNHQVNVQFLLQLKPEWQRFVTIVKQSQDLKNVSYHKLYDILKQHQNEVNKIRAERLACTPNPLALVAQQQPVYHSQTHLTHYTQNSSTRSQATTKNRGKAIVNPPQPSYVPEPEVVADDESSLKEKEIDKLITLISMSFKKIYKPTNNNLRTSSNTRNLNVDNTLRSSIGTGYDRQTRQYDNQRAVNVAGARKNELEAHYMYMAKIQEVTPDAADNSGPIFDNEPLQKVHNNDDDYNVFANVRQHPEQPEYVMCLSSWCNISHFQVNDARGAQDTLG